MRPRRPRRARRGCPTRGTMVRRCPSRLRRPRRAAATPTRCPTAPARVDRRTKNLTKRLRPGDIAVIDHVDLDRVSAEALVACRPAAVVNAAPSISGRYPNLGPGDPGRRRHPAARRRGPGRHAPAARGRRSPGSTARQRLRRRRRRRHGDGATTPRPSQAAWHEARAGLAVQLEAFAANTMEYLRAERDLLLDGVGVPDIRTELDGRHALIVVRGYHYKEDLQTLRPYIREYQPVLIGVDGGADALLEAGLQARPDRRRHGLGVRRRAALRRRDRRARLPRRPRPGARPGRASSGVEPGRLPGHRAPARTSRCCSPTTRAPSSSSPSAPTPRWWSSSTRAASGMASTFLTRLRVGGKLVDAKGVSRLYRARISNLSASCSCCSSACSPCRRPGVDARRQAPPAGARRPLGRPRGPPIVGTLHVIDFRYHLVSIVSIFLALAVGIVLGAGPLKEDLGQHPDQGGRRAAPGQDRPAAPSSTAAQQRHRGARHADTDAVSSPRCVERHPDRQAVAVVVLPGADAAGRGDRRHADGSSGAAVGSTVPRCPTTGSTPASGRSATTRGQTSWRTLRRGAGSAPAAPLAAWRRAVAGTSLHRPADDPSRRRRPPRARGPGRAERSTSDPTRSTPRLDSRPSSSVGGPPKATRRPSSTAAAPGAGLRPAGPRRSDSGALVAWS